MSASLDPDQDRRYVGPDLIPFQLFASLKAFANSFGPVRSDINECLQGIFLRIISKMFYVPVHIR